MIAFCLCNKNKLMKVQFQILLTVFLINSVSFVSIGQALPTVTLCLGEDATVCLGQPVVINDCGSVGGGPSGQAYTYSNIPYTPESFTSGTSVSLSDDGITGSIPIGFNFCFYGNTYSNFLIGSNNFITFSTGGSSTWVTTPIPNTGTVPKNAIMGPWQDINPGAGGSVRYQVYGTAPFRRLAVSWYNVPMFSCTGQTYSSQIIIYESTNVIETHILNKTICSTWNSGKAVHGLHNIDGTAAVVVTGRNDTQWSTSNEGLRFTPGNLGVEWANTLGQTFPYNGGVLNVSTVPPGTTGYFLRAVCGGSGTISDTTWLTRTSSSVSASSTADFCNAGIGTVTATPTQGTAPFTYNWPTLGQTTQTVNNVPSGSYTVVMTDNTGCPSSSTVTVSNSNASYSATGTLISCPNGTDGTATAVMTPAIGNITYLWDDPLGQTTQTATGLSSGTYSCTVTSDVGCSGTASVTINEIPEMTAILSNQVDVSCNSGNDGVLNWVISNGTAPYSFAWDNSNSITSEANDLVVGEHTVTVTDQNGCVAFFTATLNEPSSLQITSLSNNHMVCPENSTTLEVNGSGGSSPYIFSWYENGEFIGIGNSIEVDPELSNTQYCVVFSEECGSPTTDSCLIITFPNPIVPFLTPDKFSACTPGEFTFTNTSDNSGEIATMYVVFTEGSSFMLNGTDPVTMIFPNSGLYGVDLTVTSVYGCMYTNSISNIVHSLPLPIANFTFSSNPTTIFETSVMLQNSSTSDVVQWEWFSPYSSPSYSQDENPVFTFPEEEGHYPITLLVTTAEGCKDTVQNFMNIVPAILFFAPNSFTPDGDEYNQQWEFFVSGIDIYNFELMIFNRWGQMIWQTNDPNAKWDGTYNGEILQSGMYVWKASVKDPYSDLKKEFTGHINVLK